MEPRQSSPNGSTSGTGRFIGGVHGLRALAALSIVFYHSGGSIGSEKYQGLEAISQMTSGLDAGVDLFFVISGFVIALPLFLGKPPRLGAYFMNRALRIYPMAMLTALIFLVLGWLFYDRMPRAGDIVSSLFLIPSTKLPTPVVLWTLKQELLFYLVFAIAFLRPLLGLALVVIWALASTVVSWSTSGVMSGEGAHWAEWFFHPNNVQFALGVLAAYLFVRQSIGQKVARWIATASLTAFFFGAYWLKEVDTAPALTATLLGIAGFGAVLGAASAHLHIPRPVMFLGTASYSIYLIHFLFVSLGNKLLIRFFPDLPGAVALILLVAFSTAAGAGYYRVFEMPFERSRKNFLGKYKKP